jgi:uncharacterized protein (TIRG00374 family)
MIRRMSAGVRSAPCSGFVFLGVSVLAAVLFLDHVYGIHALVAVVRNANFSLIALVVLLGIFIQVIRAHRARIMLGAGKRATLGQCYSAMVIGHGIGDLVPVAPGGPVLRCLLTERLTGIPMAYSAGVYLLEGIFDGLGPALLVAYLLLALPVPGWVRLVLMVSLTQSLAFLLLPILARVRWRHPGRGRSLPRSLRGVVRLMGQVAHGFQTVADGGWRAVTSISLLSLIITALSGVQLALFLRAFGLPTPFNATLLVLALTLVAGSLPVKIPGSGTIAAMEVLHIAGIHGAAVGGFVLLSRCIFSSQTSVLALEVIGRWGMMGARRGMGPGDLFRLCKHTGASITAPAGRPGLAPATVLNTPE